MLKKCSIDIEELERDAYSYLERFDSLKDKEEDKFTTADVLAALEMYNDNYIRFPISSISKLSDIMIEKNRRNFRNRTAHLKIARYTKSILLEEGKDVSGGSPSKKHIVLDWKKAHPNGTQAECARETGLHKNTVYRNWRKEEV